jgi:SAM-dependent methyltransferase
MTDTYLRSCEHWSEASRTEMEAFYALASVDYKYLAEAFDWKEWLETRQAEVGRRRLKILDVACGSGKFPLALGQYTKIADAKISPVDYSLLDPSAFSIAEARKVLPPPFISGTEFETTLQALECDREAFDIIWATHALYAVPEDELKEALERFIFGMAGVGFIAHASNNSHYLRFYQHFLNGFKGGLGEPYSSAEQIIQTLEKMGVSHRVEKISYENGVPEDSFLQVEGYLQRCIFDDTIDLNAMRRNSTTGPYLDSCLKDGQWRFKQEVMMIFLSNA